MADLKRLLGRLRSWREQRRLWKRYEKRAAVQAMDLINLQLQEQNLLLKRHRERVRAEKRIAKSKAKDEYVS